MPNLTGWNQSTQIEGWSIYLLLLSGILLGASLLLWACLYFQIQFRRYHPTIARGEYFGSQLQTARDRVDLIVRRAEDDMVLEAALHRERQP